MQETWVRSLSWKDPLEEEMATKDILECEVKWALGSITTKLMELMEFLLSYFKS